MEKYKFLTKKKKTKNTFSHKRKKWTKTEYYMNH